MRPASAVQPSSSCLPRERGNASNARTRACATSRISRTERIEEAMRRCGGNLTRAAEALNVGRSRSTAAPSS